MESRGGTATLRIAMNTTKRFLLGVISSLLLAAGFARTADRLDPMVGDGSIIHGTVVSDGPTPPCTNPCMIGEE